MHSHPGRSPSCWHTDESVAMVVGKGEEPTLTELDETTREGQRKATTSRRGEEGRKDEDLPRLLYRPLTPYSSSSAHLSFGGGASIAFCRMSPLYPLQLFKIKRRYQLELEAKIDMRGREEDEHEVSLGRFWEREERKVSERDETRRRRKRGRDD